MDFRQLRYFVLVAEESHVGRAAEKLGIAQPALSQHIRALEQRLRVKLFVRRGRGIQLSDAGAAFLRETRATLAQAERAERVAQRTERAELGVLEIGYVGSVLIEPAVSGLVRRFTTAHPDVTLSLHENTVHAHLDTLLREDGEVAFVRGPLPALPAELVAEPFLRNGLLVVMPAGHALAGRSRLTVGDLAPFSHVALQDPPGIGLSQTMADLAAAGGVTFRMDVRVSNIASVLGMVSAGLGISMVPAPFRQLTLPGLVYRELDAAGEMVPETEVLLLHRREVLAPLTRAFLTMARAELPLAKLT